MVGYSKLQRKVRQLKKLIQYKDLSDKELEQIAKDSLEKEKLYKVDWTGLNSGESRKANSLYKNYIEKYHITKFSDVEDLKSLVYNEILKDRIQLKLGEKDDLPSKYVIDSLNSLQGQILNLKEKLGIYEEKLKEDPFKYIQILKKKFNKWLENNQGSRTIICPHCSKMIMLRIRTDAWKTQKHPFFKDKILSNKHLVKCYKEGKITKEDVAQIFGTSIDYVDWLIKKWFSQ